MNPIRNSFNSQMPNFGNMGNMMQQFNQFKNAFQGNPKQTVMNLLSSGKMSQQQFEQLSQMANQLSQFLK